MLREQANIRALFTMSSEKIKEFQHLSPLDRLQWLEESNRFYYLAVPQPKRDAWAAYMQKYNVRS